MFCIIFIAYVNAAGNVGNVGRNEVYWSFNDIKPPAWIKKFNNEFYDFFMEI